MTANETAVHDMLTAIDRSKYQKTQVLNAVRAVARVTSSVAITRAVATRLETAEQEGSASDGV